MTNFYRTHIRAKWKAWVASGVGLFGGEIVQMLDGSHVDWRSASRSIGLAVVAWVVTWAKKNVPATEETGS